MKSIFITVEGPIGVGKTSLSKAISQHWGLELLEEIVYENPFLDKFYENISEWSFQTEMFFLCNRYKQLQDITRRLQLGHSVVADYNIFKNTIFAKRTLSEDNLPKYQQIYNILTNDIPQANLVIYLKASVETAMQRIAIRGREMEHMIERSYMEHLISDYEEFMHQFQLRHPEIPVLTIECDQLDYVHQPEDLDYVIKRIAQFVPINLTKQR
ncbi:deoxynucleoside kinase [Brevibacillus laterosporus]|uniref:Deoxynucleoside kinase n=1 Tax=Brevibacillus laterosporus TaxID=1465 RepID=A0A502HHZ7_BRELA|nr:deoxynucleoside kinase [Brevibacillus laterosporus]QDX93337.1 deoxynucleoside kinase [Brevibacillus laterosporus]TPG73082.1 deoxynucleoside kinase [Brevibacillus laterosporus]TPG88361.1 deoxynucleoside kinase [Brevibacillus laterosporus]